MKYSKLTIAGVPKNRLFFVSTNHPSINAARIPQRVMKGGHDVPIPKIISRYQKSIVNCKRCSILADRVYIFLTGCGYQSLLFIHSFRSSSDIFSMA